MESTFDQQYGEDIAKVDKMELDAMNKCVIQLFLVFRRYFQEARPNKALVEMDLEDLLLILKQVRA